MLSGGTTALSKISRFSSNDLFVLLSHASEGCDFSEADVVAALAPAGTGATGYVYPFLMPLLHGATGVILDRWGDPAEAVDLIVDNRCTYAVGIPTQLTRMVEPLETRRPEAFAAFRAFLNAGAPLPYDTAAAVERLMGCRVQTSYGATDGGVPTMTTIHDPDDKRLRTVGRVRKGVECEIRDPDGKALPAGESGEVVWRSADKSWGYLGDDEQTAAAFTQDHFYKSGDIGRFDEDGYLQIVGRIKDMILRGGRNISARLIEDLLLQHPSVLDVAAAPMPDPVLGERACAFVVLKPGLTLGFDEMVDFMKARKVAVFQLPERLEIMDDLPRGPGGKVTKTKLTALVADKLKAEGRIPA
jgi:non-ribosomal peptide synthetase component E (peptide arylation enzyme)